MLIELQDKALEAVCGGAELGNGSVFLSFDSDPNTHCQLFLANPNATMLQTYLTSGNPGGQTTMGGVVAAVGIRGV